MIIKSSESEKKAVLRVAELMTVAARTAPKTKGIDNIEVLIITDSEKDDVSQKMREIGERDSLGFLIRDAGCLDKAKCVVVIGAQLRYNGLNCGFCGHPTCRDAQEVGSICAFNSVDCGIALGSAVSIAADNRVDNRIMFSIGSAVLELGYFDESVKQAFGIPLSSLGKNVFFDRK